LIDKTTFNSWVTCPQPNPQAQIRLFCLPYAGGSAAVFRTWADKLPQTIEVCPLEIPGRGRQMKTPPFTQLAPLVSATTNALLPYLNKPFAIFGYSMGALVAFELTRLLSFEYNFTPLHLFVAARHAPQIRGSALPIYNLPETEFIHQLRRFDGISNAVLENQELMQLFLPILRADFAVLDTYSYRSHGTLDFPITVFGGLQDQTVSYANLLPWKEQTSSIFSLQMVSGNHFFIHSAQDILLKTITEKLNVKM